MRLWDAETGDIVAVLEGHSAPVDTVLSIDNGYIVSWTTNWAAQRRDYTLRLWDLETGAGITKLEGHTGRVRGATVLKDGRLLSWSNDGTLRLWNGYTGSSIATLEGHTGWVRGASVLQGGWLLSWSFDRALRLWDAETGAPLAAISERDFAHQTPELHTAWVREWNSDATEGASAASGGMGGTSLSAGAQAAAWHADGDWYVSLLLAQGTVVAHCAGDLAMLQLHHGNRRVSLAQAAALLR